MLTKRYFIRVTKAILFISIIILAIFYFMATFNENEPKISFTELILQSKWKQMIYFVLIYGFVYPIIAFNSKSIYLNRSFEDQRNEIKEIMTLFRYKLVDDSNNILHFRLISPVQQALKLLFEDEIIIDYSQHNTLIIKGTHSETRRIAKRIEYINPINEDNSDES